MEEKKVSSDAEGTKLKQVHSANSWEKADLGDDQRNKKFLRLMGAGKKEHHGKIVIGEKNSEAHHVRDCTTNEKISHDLEEQYNQGLEFKLKGGARAHKGLGFHEEPPPAKETPQDSGSDAKEDVTDSKSSDRDDENGEKEEREEGESGKNETEKLAQKHKLNESDNGSKDEEPKSKHLKGFVKGDS